MRARTPSTFRRRTTVALLLAILGGLLPMIANTPTAGAQTAPVAAVTGRAPAPTADPTRVPKAAGESVSQVAASDAQQTSAAQPKVGAVDKAPYSTTEYLGSNKYRSTVSEVPLYRPEKDGSLTPLNNNVVQTSAGVSAPNALVPVQFATGKDDTVASFNVYGSTVRMRSLDVAPGAATSGASGVTVPTSNPSVNLKYQVSTDGVKEQIVIGSATGPRTYHFFVDDPSGLYGDPVSDGSGGFTIPGTSAGTPTMQLPAAVAWQLDASGNRVFQPADGTHATAHLDVQRASGGYAVAVSLDGAWLKGKTFPIVLDPTIHYYAYGRPTWGTNAAEPELVRTYGVDNNTHASTSFDYGWIYAGSVQSGSTNVSSMRSVLQWSYPIGASHGGAYTPDDTTPFNLPERAQIDQAQLWLYFAACSASPQPAVNGNCGPSTTTKPLLAYRLTSPMTSTSTWGQVNNAMAANYSQTVVNDAQGKMFLPPTTTYGGVQAQYFANGPWQDLQITDIVQGWVNNPTGGASMLLRNQDETVGNKGAFWTSNSASLTYRPYLTVTWEAVAPGPAQNITATPSGSSINVNWGASTSGTFADRYHIVLAEPSTNDVIQDLGDYSVSATSPTGSTQPLTKTISNVCPGTYRVYVIAKNDSGTAPVSTSYKDVTVPESGGLLCDLLKPTSVGVVEGNGNVTVSWNPPVIGNLLPGVPVNPVSGYHIRTYLTNGNTLVSDTVVPQPTLGSPVTSKQIGGLNNGTSYYFTVTTQVANSDLPAGTSLASPAAVPFGPPFAPVIGVVTRGDKAVTVNWLAPADQGSIPGNNGRPIDTFRVSIYEASDNTLSAWRDLTAPAGMTSQTPLSLQLKDAVDGIITNGTSYYATVTAHNLAGYGTVSAHSATFVPAGVPFAPTNVHATLMGHTATVTWDPPADRSDGTPGYNGDQISGYHVVASPPLGDQFPGPDDRSADFDNLASGTSYTFTVSANNSIGEGSFSAPSNAVSPAGAPSTPTNVQAQPITGGAHITWSPSSGNGDNNITYTVQANPGPYLQDVSNDTSLDMTPMDSETSYTFTVTARNSGGTSSASAPSNAITPIPDCGSEQAQAAGFQTASLESFPNTDCDPTVKGECNDGKDNDGDGKIDYPDDPGCSGIDDTSEGDAPPPPRIKSEPNPSSAPPFAQSEYVDEATTTDEMRSLGNAEGAKDGADDLVVFSFGTQVPGGTSGFGDADHSLTDAQIKDLVVAYVEGYYDKAPDGTRQLIVGVGTVDVRYPSTDDATAKGAEWAALVNSINDELDTYSHFLAVGANDLEAGDTFAGPAPDGPTRARAWLNGFTTATGDAQFLFFGSADGCPPTGSCTQGWTQQDYVSLTTGSKVFGVVPQIYGQSGGRIWANIASVAHTGGATINFVASLTQHAACETRACDGTDNLPATGWTKLVSALNDAGLGQPVGYSTDIAWVADSRGH